MGLSSIISTIFLAMFIFSVYEVATDTSLSSEFKQGLIDQAGAHPLLAALFVKTLDDLNPTLDYPLPFTDAKIFLINSFPLVSWLHLAVSLAILAIGGWMMRRSNAKGLKKFFWTLGLIVGSYFLASLILLGMYYIVGTILDIPLGELSNLKAAFGEASEGHAAPSLVFAAVSLLSLLKIAFVRPSK